MSGELIHIVDDEDRIRAAMASLLEVEGYRTRGWNSGGTFLDRLDGEAVACVLLDLRLPELDGLEVLRRLRAAEVEAPVIMMTGHADLAVAIRAMKLGAADFLEKPFQPAALLGAIRESVDAARTVPPRRDRSAEQLVATLSAREHEVLLGLVRGMQNKQIAHDLGISPRTVEVHRANVMTKLHTRNISQTLRVAFAAGLDPDEE